MLSSYSARINLAIEGMEIVRSRHVAVSQDSKKQTVNVEVTGAARLYRAASVWTAGLGLGVIRC